MKTFLKILLVTLIVLAAVKLLPLTLAAGCALGAVALVAAAIGLSALAIILGVAIAAAALLSPLWLPLLVAIGVVALVRKLRRVPTT